MNKNKYGLRLIILEVRINPKKNKSILILQLYQKLYWRKKEMSFYSFSHQTPNG
jgi:hypothetical protein